MSNERIFITGAASGLGREIALAFAKRKAKVCIADLNDERGAETVKLVEEQGGEAIYANLDVRDFPAMEALRDQLVEKWGGVDIVVNNAGVASASTFEKADLDTWDWMMGINFMGVVKGCKAFTPLFKKQGNGYFVNIASMAGLLNLPGMAEYNAAKAAVVSLSETLRAELQPYGTYTTVVCPSFFKTNLTESFRSTGGASVTDMERLLETSDITATDIANMIVKAYESRQFMLIPHEKAEEAHKLKRAEPEMYFQGMLAMGQASKDKQESEEAVCF